MTGERNSLVFFCVLWTSYHVLWRNIVSLFRYIFPCASSILPALSFSIWQFLPRCVRGDPAHYIAWGREILRKKSHIAISTFKYRLTGIHSMFVLNFYFLSGTKAMEETKAQCHVTSTIMQKYCSGGHRYFGKLVNKYFHILWQHISNIANVSFIWWPLMRKTN